jgi:ABC-type glycerol-3-phosphate transport system substrate-binding protein
MKKIALLAVGILLAGIPLFAGGSQSGSSNDGLTAIKVWGANQQYTWNQHTAKTTDLLDGTVTSKVWDQFVAELAKRGLKLEPTLIMNDQLSTAFQTLLASGRLNDYDFIAPVVNESTRLALVEQGRLAPLNKAIQQYSDGAAKNYYFNDPHGSVFAKRDTLADGNFYWITHSQRSYLGDPSVPWGVAILGMIRQDWLDRLGLPMPKTLDEFYNTLVAFQQRDVNGNGIRDEVAGVSTDGFGTGIPQWFGLGDSIVSAIDGKAVSPWYQNGVKDYLTYMNRLYKAGLLLIAGEGGETAANRLGYITNYSGEFWEEPNIVLPAGAAKAYFNPIIIEAVPGIPARVFHSEYGYSSFWGSSMHSIPASSKNIENTVKLIDYLVSDDFYILNNRGIKGYNYDENADGSVRRYFGTEGIDQYTYYVYALWMGSGSLFPNYARGDVRNDFTNMQNSAKNYGITEEIRMEFYDGFYGNKWPFVFGSEAVLAFPLKKEVERIAEITPDLETYSSELITSLILGEKSLANWDSYIADLKRLGLDELLGIFQARMDRAK